jgi:hypothetical protein
MSINDGKKEQKILLLKKKWEYRRFHMGRGHGALGPVDRKLGLTSPIARRPTHPRLVREVEIK